MESVNPELDVVFKVLIVSSGNLNIKLELSTPDNFALCNEATALVTEPEKLELIDAFISESIALIITCLVTPLSSAKEI